MKIGGFGPDGLLCQPAFVNKIVADLPSSEVPFRADEARTWKSRQDLRAIALYQHAVALTTQSEPTQRDMAVAGRCVSHAIILCEKWVKYTSQQHIAKLRLVEAAEAAGEWHAKLSSSLFCLRIGKYSQAEAVLEAMARDLDVKQKLDGPRAFVVARLREMAGAAATYSGNTDRGQLLLSSALRTSLSACQRGQLLMHRCMLNRSLYVACADGLLSDLQLVVYLFKYDYDEHGLSNVFHLTALCLQQLGRQKDALVAYAQARYCETRETYLYGAPASSELDLRAVSMQKFEGSVTAAAREMVAAQVRVAQQGKAQRLARGANADAHVMRNDGGDACKGEELDLTKSMVVPGDADSVRQFHAEREDEEARDRASASATGSSRTRAGSNGARRGGAPPLTFLGMRI